MNNALRRSATKSFGAVSKCTERVRVGIVLVYAAIQTRMLFSSKEQIFFAKRLSFLLSAGIPLLESLNMLRDQSRGAAQRAFYEGVCKDIASGRSLSVSLRRFPDHFSDFAVNIIEVGETSGSLPQNLEYLATELTKSRTLRRKMVGALIYPVLVMAATLALSSFLIMYLFPKITPIFTSLHVKLPLSTRIVLSLSVFLRRDGLMLVLLSIAGAVIYMIVWRQNAATRAFTDNALLHIPIFGKLVRSSNVAGNCRTLGLLLKSGTPLSRALSITAHASRNHTYKEALAEIATAVTRGERISLCLSRHARLFPNIVAHMLAVGERSGDLAETCIYTSELFEQEIEERTKELSTLFEPVLMMCMGAFVGFIAISIITPIYGITQNLHP